ncbi:MAG: mechanosensitive ion channel, partial [Myxococcales bacterium]|nr:mechanosensitive ion channel [Myxococcales bacterium]
SSWLAIRILRSVRDRSLARIEKLRIPSDDGGAERTLHLVTVANVLFDVIKALLYGFVLLTILSQCGVSVQPLVAGAGLIGAAVALGSQTIVKDFVSGCFILAENHFAIGDQIVISPLISGTVERMTLRVTAIRDVDGTLHIVPNGSIVTVTNRSYRWGGTSVVFYTPASAGVAPAREAIERALLAAEARDEKKESLLASPTLTGPSNIKGTAIEWTITARTQIGHGPRVKSWIIEEVVRELAKAQISLA